MPTRRKVCAKGGCGLPAEKGSGRCRFHPIREDPAHHPHRELYGSYRWRKASAAYLGNNPLCVRCLESDIVEASTQTDHIVPHDGDPELFWDEANWQALCDSCHSEKTAREVNARR